LTYLSQKEDNSKNILPVFGVIIYVILRVTVIAVMNVAPLGTTVMRIPVCTSTTRNTGIG